MLFCHDPTRTFGKSHPTRIKRSTCPAGQRQFVFQRSISQLKSLMPVFFCPRSVINPNFTITVITPSLSAACCHCFTRFPWKQGFGDQERSISSFTGTRGDATLVLLKGHKVTKPTYCGTSWMRFVMFYPYRKYY